METRAARTKGARVPQMARYLDSCFGIRTPESISSSEIPLSFKSSLVARVEIASSSESAKHSSYDRRTPLPILAARIIRWYGVFIVVLFRQLFLPTLHGHFTRLFLRKLAPAFQSAFATLCRKVSFDFGFAHLGAAFGFEFEKLIQMPRQFASLLPRHIGAVKCQNVVNGNVPVFVLVAEGDDIRSRGWLHLCLWVEVGVRVAFARSASLFAFCLWHRSVSFLGFGNGGNRLASLPPAHLRVVIAIIFVVHPIAARLSMRCGLSAWLPVCHFTHATIFCRLRFGLLRARCCCFGFSHARYSHA